MIKKLNKRSQSSIIPAIISLIILGSSALFATNMTLNGSAVYDPESYNNSLEKTISIEVWADTFIQIEEDNRTKIYLILDNKTLLSEQELSFYLNETLVLVEKTNPEGYTKPIFNLYNLDPGIYSFGVEFQGSSALYLNPSSAKTKIEVIEENGTKLMKLIEIEEERVELNLTNQSILNETNRTLLNETNITLLSNLICEEFTEQVFWSSNYSNNPEGSTNYQTWYPKHNCTEIGENCFLGTLEIKTRFLYFGEKNKQGEGYIQISNPDSSICNNPEKGDYSRYLAYEILRGESKKLEQYCGNNKNPNARCGVELTDEFEDPLTCYGIKAYADQYFIVDAFEIKYTLCWEENQ